MEGLLVEHMDLLMERHAVVYGEQTVGKQRFAFTRYALFKGSRALQETMLPTSSAVHWGRGRVLS